MIDVQSAILLTVILCLGMFIQSAVGFAAGLLAIPAMLWSGFSIPEAQCALMVATIPQNLTGVWILRDDILLKQAMWPAAGRLAFYPLGIWVLLSMESLSPATVRQIVGGFVFALTIAILLFRPIPRERVHPIWAFLAFPISGFLQGLIGIGGPAMVFWVQAHDWSTKRSRGFLFIMFFVTLLPSIGILYLVFGNRIVGAGGLAACIIPVLLVATFAGLRFGTWLGRERLRALTFGLLLLVGVAGLAAPWLAP